MTKFDELGDKCKSFEDVESMRRLDPSVPILARADGRAFHSFCRDLLKPLDCRFINLMQETTKRLVEEVNADLGYVQSDEISLVFLPKEGTDPFFGGRVQKLCSTLTALATLYFNAGLDRNHLSKKKEEFPTFDCRVWNVPNIVEAANAFLWRELDATKNSVSAFAQFYFSHKSLQGQSTKEKKLRLKEEKCIDWDLLSSEQRRGTYFKRVKRLIPFSKEEIERLPAKHQARTNPDLLVLRSKVERFEPSKYLHLLSEEELVKELFEQEL